MGWIIVIIVVLFLIGSANSKKQPQTKAAKWNDPNLERVRRVRISFENPHLYPGMMTEEWETLPKHIGECYSFFVDTSMLQDATVHSVTLLDENGTIIPTVQFRLNCHPFINDDGSTQYGMYYVDVYRT